MTLIRRSTDQARRAERFRAAADPAPGATGPVDDPQALALARLAAQLDEAERDLAQAREEAETAREEAFEEGRRNGLTEAEALERERTDLLAASLREALGGIEDRISRERDLAVEIALAALARVVGDPARYRELVAETARFHAAALERSTIVRLAVSAADFPAGPVRDTLERELGGLRLEADPALAAGGCRFDLTLGTVEASLPAQARAIEDLLRTLAPEAAAA